jgi:ATP-dependent Clp protease protease subunit
MKFWNFIKNAATETEPENIELRIEGDIVSDDDAWFYEWLGIASASPNAFKEELKQYSGKDITVWIDSYGGDVFAAAGIYNALMEHKGKITVKIDGKAMSAASVIAMAGGDILMSPMAIMMIHDPMVGIMGYFKAAELKDYAEYLGEVKEAIINSYQLKTNRARNKISSMMDDETYMSAKTAVKEGFADGMLYTTKEIPEDIAAFAFNRHAVMNCAISATKRFCELRQKLKLPEKPPETPPDDGAKKLAIAKARLALECEL